MLLAVDGLWLRDKWPFLLAHLPCARPQHNQESLSHNQYFKKDLSHCCELIKFMTLLVAAHLLISLIFKALSGEVLSHLLPRPLAVLHPAETIEVTSHSLCAHSFLTWPGGTGACAKQLGIPSSSLDHARSFAKLLVWAKRPFFPLPVFLEGSTPRYL